MLLVTRSLLACTMIKKSCVHAAYSMALTVKGDGCKSYSMALTVKGDGCKSYSMTLTVKGDG